MAFTTGDLHYQDVKASGTIGGWTYIDVDFGRNGTGVTATPDKFVEVPDGAGIQVLGTQILEAGTTNGDLDIGMLTAAGGAGDVDGFCDGIDMDDTAGTLEQAAGAYTLANSGGIYWNVSGSSMYLGGTNLTAANAAGRIRIFFKMHSVPVNV